MHACALVLPSACAVVRLHLAAALCSRAQGRILSQAPRGARCPNVHCPTLRCPTCCYLHLRSFGANVQTERTGVARQSIVRTRRALFVPIISKIRSSRLRPLVFHSHGASCNVWIQGFTRRNPQMNHTRSSSSASRPFVCVLRTFELKLRPLTRP